MQSPMKASTPARDTAATLVVLAAVATFVVAIALAWTVSLPYALAAAILGAVLIAIANRIAPARGHSPPSPADDRDTPPED
jgi:heme O synthase-like polyprenyltransferase